MQESTASVANLKRGDYEILTRLSVGGMSEILLACRRGFGGFRKLLALKQILQDIRGQEAFVRMFLNEARMMGVFAHPNIPQVFDLGVSGNELFLVMEFVPGATLSELARACFQNKEPIPIGLTLMAIRDTARALHYAHTFTDPTGKPASVIHRDVTPRNIMVTYEGATKLLDFGIARLPEGTGTATGTIKGTPGYLAPEQLTGQPVDRRADLFSLGVVLHECLTGLHVFPAKGLQETFRAILTATIAPPSRINREVTPALDAVCLKALARKPDERFSSALELVHALEAAAGGLIWAPEQAGLVVKRLFRQRYEETIQLLVDFGFSSGEHPAAVPSQAVPDDPPTRPEPIPPMPPPLGHEPSTVQTDPAAVLDVADQPTMVRQLPGMLDPELARPSRPIPKRDRPKGHGPPVLGKKWAPVGAQALRPGLTVGGCKLVTRIGMGSMGTVWLARQLSLDRNVAVKILRPMYAHDLGFVLQFTREALAAAQLIHHNIVQIYDSGTEGELHYFSMEYVEGEALSDLVKREGKLSADVAAGYVLQAARGLKFAHGRDMIHRDVKPENLLLNRDGIVKIADLGLVKRMTEEEITNRTLVDQLGADEVDRRVVGTPAFMAPEQANGLLSVDGRADIYSLGCTLYNLVTGQLPFEGESTAAVMSQHFFDAVVPPDAIARRVPAALSEIVVKMMAKRPEDRYAKVEEVVGALETFLGVEGSTTFSPREEHAALLERSVVEYKHAPWLLRRGLAIGALVAVAAVCIGTAFWLQNRVLGIAAAGVLVTAALARLSIASFTKRTSLHLKLRHWVLGAHWVAWTIGVVVVGTGIGLLIWFDWMKLVLELAGGGVALALAFHLLVDRRLAGQRRVPLEAVEQMLRGMRLKGLEETALRQFVCRYSGRDWEPFYEALFGYDAKLLARARWGRDERGLPRRRRGLWRDPLLRWVDRRLEARQKAKDKKHLATLEAGAIQR